MLDYKFVADIEMNMSLTYHEVEEKCRQEFQQWEKRQSEIEEEKVESWERSTGKAEWRRTCQKGAASGEIWGWKNGVRASAQGD